MKQLVNISYWTIIGLFSFGMLSCSENDDVNLGDKPEAEFEASKTLVERGETISFSDLSTNEPGLYTWNFEGGDPSYSSLASPYITYNELGKYSVTLTVRNDAGAGEITKTEYIEVIKAPIYPILRFEFEDNLADDGTENVEATSIGTITYAQGPKEGEQAAVFDGSSYVETTGYTGINGNATRSVTCWVKSDNAIQKAGIINWGANTECQNRSTFKLFDGVIRLEWRCGGINGLISVADGEWHHIAYTYDGDVVNLYVDGQLDTSMEGVNLTTGTQGEANVTIGAQIDFLQLDGMLDDVRVYSEVLSATDLQAIMEE